MGDASPFLTFTFQLLFNNINNFSNKWVLALAIAP
jgi:hypothetical protein